MNSILGRILKTLSYRVEKEIYESLYKNEDFLSSRWSFLEKSIIDWSTHYKKYILLAVVLAFLIVYDFIHAQPWVKPYVMQFLPNWKKLLEWQGAFLSGQLTIVGVVYPLVVGLVSVLFQNKSAKKVIFPIYQKYSGFMFAGLSGLALSGFIVFGYFVRATIGDCFYAAICLTSAIWLASNLLLTAWFFVITFKMLDESSRDAIVVRFSIHEACEIDVRRRIKQVLLENGVHNNLIANPDGNVLEVVTHKFSKNDYGEVSLKVKNNKYLKDVKFRFLNAAIWLQVFLLRRKGVQNCKLVIQPLLSRYNDKIMIVARYDGFVINPIVAFLIKISFSFENEVSKMDIGLTTVLNGFVGPANDAIRNGDVKDFSDSIDNLVLWHTELALALSFKNDSGSLDNWLLLPSRGLWGRSYLDELLGEYYRLAREAVERIPSSSRFYTDMLYLHKRIYSSRDSLINHEMRLLIQGSYYLWYLLIEWRSYTSESSDLRIANKYEDILYDFVGAWESWLMYIEPRSKKRSDIEKAYPAYTTHLEFTASTAISALRFNNFEAAGWGVDMLINWLENQSHYEYWDAEYTWRSVLVNHYHLSLDSGDDAWRIILRGNEFDYIAAFYLSFKNAHIDLRVITACYMLLKPGDSHLDTLSQYVKSLLKGERIHPSGSAGQSEYNISSAGELLGVYIRHRDYPYFGDGTYGTWLSSILESFGRIYEERRVSGRIYSGWGAEDPRSMNKAYVEIAISMSEKCWRMPNNWEEVLFSGYFRHRDRELLISDLRDWINIANERKDYILFDKNRLEGLKKNFIDSIEAIIQQIVEAQVRAVVEADVDHERLVEFGITSSSVFRNESSQKFPIVFFENIIRDAEVEDDSSFSLRIVDYAKERIADGLATNRAVNESEWMADSISENVRLKILRSLIKYPISESYKYTDINDVLSDVRSMAGTMACPVLFVGNQQLKRALRSASRSQDVYDRYDIRRQDGFGNEYICHIGRCEAYALSFTDIDFSLLTTKELFNTLNFRKVAENQYVNVEFELNEGSETVGSLIFKYWMRVDLTDDVSCIKLELIDEEGA